MVDARENRCCTVDRRLDLCRGCDDQLRRNRVLHQLPGRPEVNVTGQLAGGRGAPRFRREEVEREGIVLRVPAPRRGTHRALKALQDVPWTLADGFMNSRSSGTAGG